MESLRKLKDIVRQYVTLWDHIAPSKMRGELQQLSQLEYDHELASGCVDFLEQCRKFSLFEKSLVEFLKVPRSMTQIQPTTGDAVIFTPGTNDTINVMADRHKLQNYFMDVLMLVETHGLLNQKEQGQIDQLWNITLEMTDPLAIYSVVTSSNNTDEWRAPKRVKTVISPDVDE
jgi:hypothetical protein